MVSSVVIQAVALFLAASASAQGLPNCTKADTAFCATPANGTSTSNIILRCASASGTAQPGNCNDNLAGVPPVGVKVFAPCWESSPTAGDAQCVYNCVKVKAANGSEIYPLGCNKTLTSTSAQGYTSTGKTTTSTGLTTSTGKTTSTVESTNTITTGPGPVMTSTTTSTSTGKTTSTGATTSTGVPATGAGMAIIADAWPAVVLMGGALMF